MQDAALRAAEEYERQALERLRRMGLAAADLELRSAKKPSLFSSQGELMVEETLG